MANLTVNKADSVSMDSIVKKQDEAIEQKIKRYDSKCVVCGREFVEVLFKSQLIVGCPTNDLNHHDLNKKAKEEAVGKLKEEAKEEEGVKEKVKKDVKKKRARRSRKA